jgi:hypothetical protein
MENSPNINEDDQGKSILPITAISMRHAIHLAGVWPKEQLLILIIWKKLKKYKNVSCVHVIRLKQ